MSSTNYHTFVPGNACLKAIAVLIPTTPSPTIAIRRLLSPSPFPSICDKIMEIVDIIIYNGMDYGTVLKEGIDRI
jgi:hypothetical protein